MSFTREVNDVEITNQMNTVLVNSDYSEITNTYLSFTEHGTQFVKTDNSTVKIHTYLLWALGSQTFPVKNPPTNLKISDISSVTFRGVINQLPADSIFVNIYTTPDFNDINAWTNQTKYDLMFSNMSGNAGILEDYSADISSLTSSSDTDSIFAIALSTNSTSNDIDVVINNIKISLENGYEINLDYPELSPVCFLEGTRISTDQGPISIEYLTKEHTIFGSQVNNITESFNYFNHLIHFKPNALNHRIPCKDTYVTPTHAIYCPINKMMKMAKDFCDGDKVVEDYTKDATHKIYNVVIQDATGELQSHSMYVNNLLCETLHPTTYSLVRNQLKF